MKEKIPGYKKILEKREKQKHHKSKISELFKTIFNDNNLELESINKEFIRLFRCGDFKTDDDILDLVDFSHLPHPQFLILTKLDTDIFKDLVISEFKNYVDENIIVLFNCFKCAYKDDKYFISIKDMINYKFIYNFFLEGLPYKVINLFDYKTTLLRCVKNPSINQTHTIEIEFEEFKLSKSSTTVNQTFK